MTNIWLLCDDRIGNINQILGVAQGLDMPYKRIDICYTKWVKLPNFLRGKSLIGVKNKTDLSTPNYPDIVISAGRRCFPVAKWIKKQSHNKTKIVHLMDVGKYERGNADLLILPQHDNYKGHDKNVMLSLGTPHQITPEKLAIERKKWTPKFKKYKAPILSLIVGGGTKNNPFTIEMAAELVLQVKKLPFSSILITTSRRTPDDVVDFLKKSFDEKTTFFYAYGNSQENPYFGLLSCADIIVVTGDSMSMCSECCATSAPVFIYAPPKATGPKHKRFHTILYKNNYALKLGQKPKKTKGNFNPTTDIVDRIKKLVK